MNISVGTKVRKKQPASSQQADAQRDTALEQSLLALEGVCVRLLESRFATTRDDLDRLTWQQRFKNIVTPVSLALAECKGPRHFHYHYRHREDDESVLHPVMENPLDTLSQACRTALAHCQSDLVGIPDDAIAQKAQRLEQALAMFLKSYRAYQSEVA